MARRKKVPFLVRFRTLLLVLILGVVAALIGLYQLGRAGLPGPPTTAPLAEDGETAPDEDVTSQGEDFDFTQYEEDRAIFRIRGGSYRITTKDRIELENVALTLYRENGDYQIASRKALYRQRNKSAELEGKVEIEGPGGFELFTEKLTVGPQGRRIRSPVPTAFAYGETLQGRADSLRIDVATELYLLQGNVVLRGTGPGVAPSRLRADRAYFEQARRLVRAEGEDLDLIYGNNLLRARRLTLYLDELEDHLRFVRARWDVQGELTVSPPGAPRPRKVGYTADNASVVFGPDKRPRKVELEAGIQDPASLVTTDPETGLVRRLDANYIVGDFAGRALTEVQAFGQVHLTERPAGGDDEDSDRPLLAREARSERAVGDFDANGALETLQLLGNVDYRADPYQAVGSEATVTLATEATVFTGSESEPVRLQGPDGYLTAPQVTFGDGSGRVEARGGVRASLDRGGEAAGGPILGGGSGPVLVEADEADWIRGSGPGDGTFTFRGAARAWRGVDLLLGDVLRIYGQGEQLEAEGKVKTVWHPASTPRRPRSGPLEIDGGSLRYDQAANRLTYRRDVVLVDEGRTIQCDELDVLVSPAATGDAGDDKRNLERLSCQGDVRLRDADTGRLVTGDLAIYDPEGGIIDITGETVALEDRGGTRVQGKRVLYQVETGTAEFMSLPKTVGAPSP